MAGMGIPRLTVSKILNHAETDITAVYDRHSYDAEKKIEAIRCYSSQFEGEIQAGEVYPNGEPLETVVRQHGAYYGTLIRRPYGEPYFTTEVMMVDDVVSLGVSTF